MIYRPLIAVLFLVFGPAALVRAQYSGPPLASGHGKFLGSIYSTSQAVNLPAYFNQVTPENAGKWGSVEATRDVMNWSELDAAYLLAKNNGFPFRMHILVWGNQQPAWIETLSTADQLAEIEEWFAAVAARYPAIDYLEVVNEALHDPPNAPGNGGGNYINALGGAGVSGWEWIVRAYRMARLHFPSTTKLVINEYSVTNNAADMQRYIGIINVLKAENLIDVVGVQGHAFSTTVPAATTKSNLDLLATTGLPIMVTEMDIDGLTDQIQLDEYKRIFPVFWEHPSVIGITLWGYRPGLWRNAQQAYIVLENGTERPAMVWLKSYLTNTAPSIPAAQTFYLSETAGNGSTFGTVVGSDPNGATLRNWQIIGGTGAGVIAVNSTTGQLSVANSAALNASSTPSYTLAVTVSDGRDTSAAANVTINVYAAGQSTSRLVNIATRAYCSTGNNVTIGGFVIAGSVPKRVLVRGVGPSLTDRGLTPAEVMADPMIELYKNGVVEASNDDWGAATNASDVPTVAAQIGAGALKTGDTTSSALLLILDPGVYSFVAKGKNSSSGIVLLEVYDADATNSPSKFVNIATRAYATTGNGVTIGGFVISGSIPKQVLLRALGPTLTGLGIAQSEALADPVIALYRAGGAAPFDSNDNWGSNANAALITSTGMRIGATPFGTTDTTSSALLVTLNPGVYSFIASGKGGASGIVLVEVYDAD
jgi:GH35 family endo-1,4-beta-xylanase